MAATAPEIALPKSGGAVAGLGDSFQPDPFTGTGRFSVPLEVPAGRNGLAPTLALTYSSGQGNGPFGVGWGLPVPSISRSTRRGIPRYGRDDTFVWDGGEDLIPMPSDATGRQRYRPRVETTFARIERVTDAGHGHEHWEVRTGDGRVHLYGTPQPVDAPDGWRDPAALVDPDDGRRVAAWFLTLTTDACGNTIRYRYARDPDGAAGHFDQLYLTDIGWADHGTPEAPDYLVGVQLHYAARPDVLSGRRFGFRVTTAWRCTAIETQMGHVDPPIAARRVELSYRETPGNRLSLLATVRAIGIDGELTEAFPPVEFDYTAFDPAARRFLGVSVPAGAAPPFALAARDVELLDVDGSGLPSIVQLDDASRVWANRGQATLARPAPLRTSVSIGGLEAPGVQLADADGDGRPDLVLSGGAVSGYFPLATGDAGANGFVRWTQAPPFALDAPDVRLIDLDGDGVSDALRLSASSAIAYSDPVEGWTGLQRLRDGAPPVSFLDPRVKLTDMTGDGLTDIVVVHDRRIEYWPYRGYGVWESTPVTMRSSPALPDGSRFDPQRLLLGDVDGDGLADAVYVDDGTVTVWLNQAGVAFAEPVVIRGTPPFAGGDAVRLTDFLGVGTAGVLWSSVAGTHRGDSYRFLDLTGAVKPYLLAGIDNHTGARTAIEYASSTSFMLADEAAGTPWRTTLPFPVQVVARITVDEAFTGSTLTSEYRYHHGHWDGAEREFRGFGRVDQRDTSQLRPVAPVDPPVTKPGPVSPVQRGGRPPDAITHREPNAVANADFSAGVAGPVTVVGAGATVDAAATGWTARNETTDPSASTTTERPATGGLRVSTNAAGCRLAQALHAAGAGPSRALLRVSVLVERGRVGIGTGDGDRVTLLANASESAGSQGLVTVNARSPVSEVVIAAVSPGGADFRLAAVAVEPLLTGNLLENPDFAVPFGDGTTTLQGPGHGGQSAAADWTTWNNSDATTTTELLASTRPGGTGRMLHVTTGGPGNGIVQTFLSTDTGPRHARASALVKVVRGTVLIATGNGGSIEPDAMVQAGDGWQLLAGDNHRTPANELVIYSAGDGGAEFLVDWAWVSEHEPTNLEYSPPTESRKWFHLGPVGPEHGNWVELDLADEQWPEDPALFASPADARSAPELDRQARRDAVRALRGRTLRTELYALDGGERADRPVTVTEHQVAVTAVASAPGVSFPHELAQRTSAWDQGDEPMTRASFSSGYDDYGRARRGLNVAVARGAGEPHLVTASEQIFATADTAARYRLDRVSAHLEYEILNDGSLSLGRLRAAVEDGEPKGGVAPKVIGAQYKFYDGQPFVGLPWGQLGDHGLETRTERLVLTRGMLAGFSDRDPPYLWPFPSDGAGILAGEYFADADLGRAACVRPDAGIAVPSLLAPDPAMAAAPLSVRWKGDLVPRYTERCTLSLELSGGARLWLGDQLVIDAWDVAGARVLTTEADLEADQPVSLTLEYRRLAVGHGLALSWSSARQAKEELPRERLRAGAVSGPPWSDEYPEVFRSLVPGLAGYAYRSHAVDAPQPAGFDGYHAVTGHRYDARGLVTVARDELGHDTSVAYERYDLLPAGVTDAGGLSTHAEYDYRLLKPATVTDPNGNRTRLKYTPLGMLSTMAKLGKEGAREGDTDAQPGLRLSYDLVGAEADPPRPLSVHSVRRVEHRWNLVAAQNERRAAAGLPPLTAAEEAALFPSDETTSQPKRFVQTREFSDGLGRLLQIRSQAPPVRFGDPAAPDDASGLPAVQDAATGAAAGRAAPDNVLVSGWTIRDNKGRVVHAYEPSFASGFGYGPNTTDSTRQRVTTRYDALGRVVSVTTPDGSQSLNVYGVPGTVASPDPRFPDAFEPNRWISYRYDANDSAGRTAPLLSLAWLDHWATPTSSTVDALGRTVEFSRRGAAGEVLTTSTRFDIRGNPVAVADPLGRTVASMSYDLAERPWLTGSLDAGTMSHVIDPLGSTLESRDAKGALMLAATDALHRPTHTWARDGADGTTTLRLRTVLGDDAEDAGLDSAAARAANLLGRPYLACDEAGAAWTPAHDLGGNVVRSRRRAFPADRRAPADWQPPPGKSLSDHVESQLESIAFDVDTAHDALGRPTRTVTPKSVDGARHTFETTYDPAGRVTAVSLDGTPYVDRIAYDAHGRRILLARASPGIGVMTRYAYDAHSLRLSRLRDEPYRRDGLDYAPTGADQLQDLAYAYDLVGNVLSTAESAAAPPVREYVYDPHYRLVNATGRESGTMPSNPWDAGPRDTTHVSPYREEFTYDAAENLRVLAHTRTDDGQRWVRRFQVAAEDNRIVAITSGSASVDYATDACGNLTGETTSRSFGWDWKNRLLTFQTKAGAGPPSVDARYRYDAAGQRLDKIVQTGAGVSHRCVYVGGLFDRRSRTAAAAAVCDELHVLVGAETIARVRVGDALDGDETPPIAFDLTDHLRSATVTVDDQGAFVRREEYSPYGETTLGGYGRKRYRFTGRERDEESGIAYHGARYYLPGLGRWASVDPAGIADGLNGYEYAHSNPVKLVDPTGTAAQPDPQWHLLQQTELRQSVTATARSSGITQWWRDAAQGLADQWQFGKVDVGHTEPFALTPPGKTVDTYIQPSGENRALGATVDRAAVDEAKAAGQTVRSKGAWPNATPGTRYGQPSRKEKLLGVIREPGVPTATAAPAVAAPVAEPTVPSPQPVQLELEFAPKTAANKSAHALAATATATKVEAEKATSAILGEGLAATEHVLAATGGSEIRAAAKAFAGKAAKYVPFVGIPLGIAAAKHDWAQRDYFGATMDIAVAIPFAGDGVAFLQVLLSSGSVY